jgi:CheY-like chemotaxis protein/HPt (histidine-containing phosphotransfer) domain-containing protein
MVVAAGGFQRARKAVAQQRFDLILLDAQLPAAERATFLGAVRRKANTQATGARVRVIALVASRPSAADRRRYREAGMDRVLLKPFRAATLLEAVRRAGASSVGATPTRSHRPTRRDGVNRMALLARANGDVSLLREMGRLFLSDASRWLSRIRSAIASGDRQRLERSSRALRVLLETVSAKASGKEALRLETMGRTGRLRDADELCDGLEQDLARLKPLLATIGTSDFV